MDRTPAVGLHPGVRKREDLEMTLISAGLAEQLVAALMDPWKMETEQKRLKG